MATYKQLSDANADGTRLGQSATDLIGFYGATPIVKPATAGQSAVGSTTITTAASTTITSVASTSLTALDVTRINALVDRVEAMRVVQAAHVTRTEEQRVLLDAMRTANINLGLLTGSA